MNYRQKWAILKEMLYTLHQVSERVGLSVRTLRNYTAGGASDLVRGVDFIIQRTTPYRRRVMVTDRGLLRLQTRRYHVFRVAKQAAAVMPLEKVPIALRPGLCRSERRMRMRAAIQQAGREYERDPCAITNCPCPLHHKFGIPQADQVAEILSERGSATPYNYTRSDWHGDGR